MDILNNEILWNTLNGANGVLIVFVVFVGALFFGVWNVIKFSFTTLKEMVFTLNSTLQEIKNEINNLSTKVEKLSELPHKVEVLTGRLEAIENTAHRNQSKRVSR